MTIDSNKVFGKTGEALKNKDFECAIGLYKQVLESGEQSSVMVARNLLGSVYEKIGKLDEAEVLYRKNIEEDFDGTHPYKRLVVIYKKQKRIGDEIRVLNQAVDFFRQYYNADPARTRTLETISSFKKCLDDALKRKG